jgi:hypothetical protein
VSSIKILFLTADPSDAARLRSGQELRDIREKLQLAKLRDNFTLESREAVRSVDITQAILDIEPQIIHFSGHGTITGELCFEDLLGNAKPVEPKALAALFKLIKIDCVILNACYAEAQAKAITQHVDYVIGMSQAIGDQAAIAFSVGFYKALGANKTVREAYEFGCLEIQLQGIEEYLTPVIYEKNKDAKDDIKSNPLQGVKEYSTPIVNRENKDINDKTKLNLFSPQFSIYGLKIHKLILLTCISVFLGLLIQKIFEISSLFQVSTTPSISLSFQKDSSLSTSSNITTSNPQTINPPSTAPSSNIPSIERYPTPRNSASIQVSRASSIFFCKQIDGVPATVAVNKAGREAVIILWVSSDYFGTNYTPQKRCEEVSKRFQANQENGNLSYIVPGNVAGNRALCASQNKVSELISCTDENLLMILRPWENANEIINNLMDINSARSSNPLRI